MSTDKKHTGFFAFFSIVRLQHCLGIGNDLSHKILLRVDKLLNQWLHLIKLMIA